MSVLECSETYTDWLSNIASIDEISRVDNESISNGICIAIPTFAGVLR